MSEECFELVLSRPRELIQKGSGDVIVLSNLRHFAVDALMEPSELDHFDTGMRI